MEKGFARLEKIVKLNQSSLKILTKELEKLALATAKGFEGVDQKFTKVDRKFDILTDEIRLIKDDIHDLKITTRMLVGTDTGHEKRITALEMKAV